MYSGTPPGVSLASWLPGSSADSQRLRRRFLGAVPSASAAASAAFAASSAAWVETPRTHAQAQRCQHHALSAVAVSLQILNTGKLAIEPFWNANCESSTPEDRPHSRHGIVYREESTMSPSQLRSRQNHLTASET